MKTKPSFSVLAISAVLCSACLFLGCGGEEVVEVDLEKQADQLQTTFADAPPAVQQEMSTAVDAIKKEEYGRAYMKLRQMQQNNQQPMSVPQGMEAMQTMKDLRIRIAQLAAQGDPNAQRLMKDIERMQFLNR